MNIDTLEYKDIKPCPFCKQKEFLMWVGKKPLIHITCRHCGCQIYGAETPEKALKLWNKRTKPKKGKVYYE